MSYQAEFVEWLDSHACLERWTLVEELNPGLAVCRSVGFVVHEDDRSLTLALSYGVEEGEKVGEVGMSISIPKAAIVERKSVTRHLQAVGGTDGR